jgi:hypothetical protein
VSALQGKRVIADHAAIFPPVRTLLASGWTASRIRAHANPHRWQRIGTAIIRHNGDPGIAEPRRVALAVQGPRALLTAFTALHEDGLTGWDRSEIHLLVPRGARVVRPPELPLRIHYTGRWDRVEQVRARRLHASAPAAVLAAAECDNARHGCGLLAAVSRPARRPRCRGRQQGAGRDGGFPRSAVARAARMG